MPVCREGGDVEQSHIGSCQDTGSDATSSTHRSCHYLGIDLEVVRWDHGAAHHVHWWHAAVAWASVVTGHVAHPGLPPCSQGHR